MEQLEDTTEHVWQEVGILFSTIFSMHLRRQKEELLRTISSSAQLPRFLPFPVTQQFRRDHKQ